MKRILVSMLTIAIVAVVGFAVTRAYFSDTETSSGNTITAGTIDISVDNENPWIADIPDQITDMKPSYVRWTRHVVRNVGNNPVRLWKHIKDVGTDNNGWSEQECTEAGGTWDGTNCTGEPAPQEQNNIDEYIVYDMYKDGTVSGDPEDNWLGGVNSGGTVVIDEGDGITVADIESVYVYLGQLAPSGQEGDEVVVWQSYHMKDETGNWAQTDTLSYTIEFYAEQVNGTGPTSHTLLLENKNTGGDWSPITGDGIWGVLKWDGDGSKFDFTLSAYGLTPSTNYSLIYYADPWPGNNPGALIKSKNSDASGDLSTSGDVNLGIDLPDPADANYPTGAKIWLIPSSAYNSGTKGVTVWPPANDWLFEYNLIKYDDTNAP